MSLDLPDGVRSGLRLVVDFISSPPRIFGLAKPIIRHRYRRCRRIFDRCVVRPRQLFSLYAIGMVQNLLTFCPPPPSRCSPFTGGEFLGPWFIKPPALMNHPPFSTFISHYPLPTIHQEEPHAKTRIGSDHPHLSATPAHKLFAKQLMDVIDCTSCTISRQPYFGGSYFRSKNLFSRGHF